MSANTLISNKNTSISISDKDAHTLIVEAREMLAGLSALAGNIDGKVETLTGEQLFFLFLAITERLNAALSVLEAE